MSKPIVTIHLETLRRAHDSLLPVPFSPEELADEALRVVEKGVTIISLDAETYGLAAKTIRKKIGDRAIIQLTTELKAAGQPEKKMKLVKDLKPESVSVALREFIPRPDYEVEAEEFFTWLKENKVLTQYVLYNTDEVKYFADLAGQRIIPEGDNFVRFAGSNFAQFIKVASEAKMDLSWSVPALEKEFMPADDLRKKFGLKKVIFNVGRKCPR